MGKVLKMPKKQNTTQTEGHFSKVSQQENLDSLSWALLEEDKFFIEIIKEWPCFASLKYNVKANDIFHQYCKNKLTSSQECVVDFMLHIHDSNFVFDVNFSLTVWNKSDQNFFFYFLKQHADVLNQ